MSKVVLFDIDGTLVMTGGAGSRALSRACREIAGMSDALTDVPFAGRTDWSILHDAMHRLGRALDERQLADIKARYVIALAEEIQQPGRSVKGVLPGVRELLSALDARQDVFLGLLTGNFEQGARIKLEYFDLWRYFRCGAFGDDALDRNALVPLALQRAQACGFSAVSNDAVVVVGDTPNDVACARAVGARPVGVATGSYSVEQLRVSGAEDVFEDLSETGAFLRIVDDRG